MVSPPLPSNTPTREQLCLFKIDFDPSERVWFLRTWCLWPEMACTVLRRYWGSADCAVILTDNQERLVCPWSPGRQDTFADIGVVARMFPCPRSHLYPSPHSSCTSVAY